MGTVRGYVELLRPGNAIAAGVLTFIGAFVAGGLDSAAPMAIAITATVLATGAGNAINDYFDREIDAINQPDRPIPRGAVGARAALGYSLVLFGVASGITLLLPPLAIAIAVADLAALIAYTKLFKGLPGVGNLVVGLLTGSTFVYGGSAVGGDLSTVGVLFGLAASATVAREIVKDVEDIAGDREEGLNTLPIAIGERRALVAAALFVVVAVVASPLPYVLRTFGVGYLIALAPAVGLLLGGAYRSFDDPTRGQTLLKVGMFAAAVAFVLGRATVVL
ncbi:geranylgeranylglycerol-phosphate geranylgeranyltransferase [Natronomonas gomsonensis]|uniref:geranylgeranylglycerol-phosphate geranylgeranyltransferase n=1 Tax=Natronomonas gomsonensis TaxID=1046043 RepID=UPI0020CA9309|nr:geranylgeranylglycerol-phosphate geranylgeranyltransferase [Natronomonas gomsonensis]MCY4730135.1 geranylgeranylglycerol-phosphate geranylgeranyltransferase [Natronomonas gomsonensis]